MNPVFDLRLHGVSDVYAPLLEELRQRFRRHVVQKILVVVDGSISLTEAPSAFGVGRMIRLLRESNVGCTRFEVHTARRNASTAGDPTYTSFRFHHEAAGQPLINQYHQIWCFGFSPGNDAGPDSNITQPAAMPLEDAELTELTRWMNGRQGGLLAMGDHDYLGASMCHRIPRIRSMRRWTNAQGVPPIGGAFDSDTHLRHDTNRPATPAEDAGMATIAFSNQEDATPQRIEWTPWMVQPLHLFQFQQRPHPVMCHPSLGPIDVMPDHPHEGWCYEPDEIDLSAPLNVPGLSGDEYPTHGGVQPRPFVAAYGNTTRNPPHRLAKGLSPGKRFGMVSVYDGHQAAVGRVVTDSTWHHWFDENIQAIEAAGGDNWAKISRYYLNVALWLAPPASTGWCLTLDTLATHLSYAGAQEFRTSASLFDLGQTFHAYLRRRYGPCWVTQWTWDRLRLVDDDLWSRLRERLFWKEGVPFPKGDPCLSCPPFELLEWAVLGGLVRASFDVVAEIKDMAHLGNKLDTRLEPESLVKVQLAGVADGVKLFRDALASSAKELQTLVR